MRSCRRPACSCAGIRAEPGILLLLFVLVASTSFLFAAAPRLLEPRHRRRRALCDGHGVSHRARRATCAPPASSARAPAAVSRPRMPMACGARPELPGLDRAPDREPIDGRHHGPPRGPAVHHRRRAALPGGRHRRDPAGRGPLAGGSRDATPAGTAWAGRRRSEQPPTVFEAALSTTEAEAIDAQLGDRPAGRARPDRPLLPKSFPAIAPTEIEIVGLFEPLDSNAGELERQRPAAAHAQTGQGRRRRDLRDSVRGGRGLREPAGRPAAVPLRLALRDRPRPARRRPGRGAACRLCATSTSSPSPPTAAT